MSEIVTPEEHPVTAMVIHWVHLISMFILIFTGSYIHNPWFAGAMGAMRQWHFVAMWVFILTTVVRIYWAFFGAGSANGGSTVKVRDARHFLAEKSNKGEFWPTLKYYVFVSNSHTPPAKYNPLQKAAYNVIPLLVLLQALTGFALYAPFAAFFSPMTAFLGGLGQVRMYHYLIMFVFVVFLMVHIYLSAVEEPQEFPAMFFGVRQPGGAPAKEGPESGRAA
jgi:Ni/Fe-hydrogenase 1 B-type cytochrome subunit